ncbi:MAG: sulfotransferase [Sphingopyxis sp.]|nr:sulfotransferase [Sphingopyxis sp.]
MTADPKALLAEVRLLVRQRQFDDALKRLSGLTGFDEHFGEAEVLELDVLILLGRHDEALARLDTAVAARPTSADALDALAYFARSLGKHRLSNSLYRDASAAAPDDAQILYNLATSERSLGDLAAAASAAQRALALDPSALPTLLLRSELSKATSAQNNVRDLKQRRRDAGNDRSRMFVGYALGKELHDLGQHADAFASFEEGAAARRRSLQYDVAVDEEKLARIARIFTQEWFEGTDPGKPEGKHIFIFGLPRSGTTLVERILSALPDVRSNGETDNFTSALVRNTPPGPGDLIARSANASFGNVGGDYDRLSGGSISCATIEKLPLNYLYVGLIAKALPDAKLIHVRRPALDSCFAMFRTLFGQAYPFSYDFHDLARYYAAYDRLMGHWRQTLPGRLNEITYDDLVRSPEEVAKNLAARCGLIWSDEALDLAKNAAPSFTASASQVRGSIYTSSSGSSSAYGKQLAPLSRELERNGIRLDDLDSKI